MGQDMESVDQVEESRGRLVLDSNGDLYLDQARRLIEVVGCLGTHFEMGLDILRFGRVVLEVEVAADLAVAFVDVVVLVDLAVGVGEQDLVRLGLLVRP